MSFGSSVIRRGGRWVKPFINIYPPLVPNGTMKIIHSRRKTSKTHVKVEKRKSYPDRRKPP